MFQEGKLPFDEVARQRGISISTAVEYVLKAGQELPLDWKRVASELQLGPNGMVRGPGDAGG